MKVMTHIIAFTIPSVVNSCVPPAPNQFINKSMLGYTKPNDYSNPEYIGSQFRRKRFQFFESRIKSFIKPVTILDIGGKVDFWVNENFHNRKDVQITLLNLEAEKSDYHNIRAIQGDACNLSQFKDHAFDIAFSNSLIEHLFTKENQEKMAREAMRVGKFFFVQTPNRYFPIEPHFKFPFFQFLPRVVKIFLLTRTSLINRVQYDRQYAENVIREIQLMSKSEFQSLFPGCDLYEEKFAGFLKSFVAHNLPRS
jgi:ubiquinone/menaquinone biosynthesis C-methylase UbiE